MSEPTFYLVAVQNVVSFNWIVHACQHAGFSLFC